MCHLEIVGYISLGYNSIDIIGGGKRRVQTVGKVIQIKKLWAFCSSVFLLSFKALSASAPYRHAIY
jgi:hypothetical protein